jgi:hypothetical protein
MIILLLLVRILSGNTVLEKINPLLGNENDLLAYATGSGMTLGKNGFVRMVLPSDAKAGRYASKLESVTFD